MCCNVGESSVSEFSITDSPIAEKYIIIFFLHRKQYFFDIMSIGHEDGADMGWEQVIGMGMGLWIAGIGRGRMHVIKIPIYTIRK